MTRVIYNSTTASTVEYTAITDSPNTTTATTTTTSSSTVLLKAVGTVTQGTLTTAASAATATNGSRCTTTTTEKPFDEFGPPEGVEYIFVPLGVMIFVLVLTAVVLIISRRRKLERLRHRLMPLYNFDPGEEGEDDWETELLDENLGNRQRRQGYQSMDNEENAELFSH